MSHQNSKIIKWFSPLLFLLLIAPFSEKIDLSISNFFYESSGFSKHLFHRFIFHGAVMPAFILGGAAAIIFLLSYIIPRYHHLRLPSFFVGFVLGLGPGVIAQCVLKGFLARPRPVQTIHFGGIHHYTPFFSPTFSFPNTLKSLPSGHSTMGFYFLCLVILGQRLKSSTIKTWGIYLTIILGFLLSLSRIAQGAHFFTDVCASFCLLWYVSLISDWFVFEYLAKNRLLSYIKK